MAYIFLSQRWANDSYAYYGTFIALQSMVITKQQQIGGEGEMLVKLAAHLRDLTSFPDRGTPV